MLLTVMAALALLAPAGARAGSLVDVSVQVAGSPVSLYPAVDGSGRLYFEALAGCDYTLRLVNRTHERLGALLVVDGLNAISGEREEIGRRPPGRMYVLSPWDDVEVRGWRTSLDEVRRFTFVDERSSYAARAGKANGHVGWVEVAVYRDREAHIARDRRERGGYEGAAGGILGGTPSRDAEAPAPEASADRTEEKSARADGRYPGTGWGAAAWDPATEVRFAATIDPVERTVLRYEYAPSLRALGVLPRPRPDRDRLGERDRGDGFAAPPRW
jgi:hypothetical protein